MLFEDKGFERACLVPLFSLPAISFEVLDTAGEPQVFARLESLHPVVTAGEIFSYVLPNQGFATVQIQP